MIWNYGLQIPALAAHYGQPKARIFWIMIRNPKSAGWTAKMSPDDAGGSRRLGLAKELSDNAVRQAHTPTFDHLWATCPHSLLAASGEDVGLPKGQMGHSEVGHLTIGAGRVVKQPLLRIGDAIADGEIEGAPACAA